MAVNLAGTIDALRGLYRSVEIKAVAVPQGGKWIAAFLKIRFTRETVEELRNKHQQKEERLVEMPKGQYLKVFFLALKIDGMGELLRHVMVDGQITLEGIEINLPGTEWQELPTTEVQNSTNLQASELHLFMTTKEESEGYPFLYASSSRGRSHIGSVVHESTSKARVDVGINDDEIASWLDLPNLNFVMNVCFMLPLYFREREITVSSSSNQIAEYEMQPALAKSCDVHAIRYSSWNLKKKQRMDTPANDASVDVIVPITVDDRALAQNEYFVVEIRHKTLGVLLNKRYYEADLPTDASQAEASLWKVFRLFETSTSLRPYLLGVKERQEPASSWLFGLLGFNVVCLAFKNISERMLDTSGKERGSCDLIVQDPESGAILVVDDTQSRPDDKKIDAIRGTARFITEQTGIPLTPVILAGEECNTIKRTLQSDAVRVIDRADVNGIVDLIEKGDVKRARDLLIGLVQKPPPYVNPFG